VVLTARKAADWQAHERRQKRGGGKVVAEADLAGAASWTSEPGLDRVMGSEPTPSLAAQIAEECRRLLERLGKTDLRRVAAWKLEGYTNAEIAVKIKRDVRTVERKLEEIRKLWEPPGTPAAEPDDPALTLTVLDGPNAD